MRRWGLAIASAVIAFAWIVFLYWNVLRSVFSGASIYSQTLLPTDASFSQLVHAATTSWAYTAGTGISAPSAPWLLVLMVVSVFTAGHVATAVRRGVLLVRSFDGAVVLGFGWNLYSVRHGALRDRVGMVRHRIVDERVQRCRRDDDDGHGVSSCGLRVFFPSRRHVRTEDLVNPQASVQAAALAALCFIPVVAAEPQLLLPLMLSFLVFLMLVRSHRTTLLLIPLPAASVCAPTLVNTVRFAGAGTWRQIFGSVILPSSAHDGHPMIANLSDIVSRAFGVAYPARFGSMWLLQCWH